MQPQVNENVNPASFQGGNGDVYYSTRNYPPPPQQSAMRSASVSALHYGGEVHQPTPQQQNPGFYQQQQPYAHHASLVHLNTPPPAPVEHQKNQPLMRGWLFHWEGWPIKYWHKRWAVLRLGTLNVYKSSTSDKLLNSFLLHNYRITVSGRDDKNYRRFAFRCEAPGLKTLYFATEAESDMNEWVRALQSAVQPMGTFHSHPQVEQKPEDAADYSRNANTLPYQRQMAPPPNFAGIPPAANINYQPQPQLQQQQVPMGGGYYGGYKQSPPLPPPVRFPPPPPQQQQQQQPSLQQNFAYNQQQQQQQQFMTQNNYENQQPPSFEQQKQQTEMSASRQRYGAFIQQLDEERRKRSASMIGLPISAAPPPSQQQQQQQPLPLQNQQQNSLPPPQQAYDYGGRDRYGYSTIPTTIPPSSQPILQPPSVIEQPIIPQSSSNVNNRYSAPFLYSQQGQQNPHELTQQNSQWSSSSIEERPSSIQQRQSLMSVAVPQQQKMVIDTTYASPSINSSTDVQLRNNQNNNMMMAQPCSPSSRNKIPNLQERMYSLMRCVSSDAGNAQSAPSLSHWLVRDMATGSNTMINDEAQKRDDDQTSGTLTPGATPSKIEPPQIQKQSNKTVSQVSPQYSQVVKKVTAAPQSQSSSMYVEHWLDAHASEPPQNGNTVDSDPMSQSPEPPRRVEDVFGKTRDELVLMLIQLRRRQAQGRYVDPTLYQIIEQQLAAERSVINLVDNVVAPYGSPESNTLRRQRNVERINSERALVAGQLSQDNDADFEGKQAIFWRLDEAVNRQTEVVTSLQEQHQQLIDAINVIRSRMSPSNPNQIHQLTQLESSLHGIRASLATASRHLESLIFQRNQLEKQLQELKVRQVANSAPSRSLSVPTLQFIRASQNQQPQQQPQQQFSQRCYPQPVVQVAPMLQQRQPSEPPLQLQQPERSTEVQSPVYATVRRYQNQNSKAVTQQLPEPQKFEESAPYAYSAPPPPQQQQLPKPPESRPSEFKQPEPIYSRPVRFQPQSTQLVQPPKTSQTPPIGVSRISSILASNQVQTQPPMHSAASMSMLSDAGSEATIDSLARQYTGPYANGGSSRQPHEVTSSRQNSTLSGNGTGGDDVELVDMVQRALAVVGEPAVEIKQEQILSGPLPQQTSRLSSVTAPKTSSRSSALPAIYNTSSTSAIPRRFSSHLRAPTPPPPENQQEEVGDFEVEPESFERDVFGAPDKIEIPERYDPSVDVEDTWPVDSSEGGEEREQRSERYRQMLLKQSLSNLTQEEAMNLSSKSTDLHSAIRQESQERHRLLRLSQAVAQQAKDASIHQAERLRRSLPALNHSHLSDLPPSMPPPPPPQNNEPQSGNQPQTQQQKQGGQQQTSPETLWMEFGNREMAIDVC